MLKPGVQFSSQPDPRRTRRSNRRRLRMPEKLDTMVLFVCLLMNHCYSYKTFCIHNHAYMYAFEKRVLSQDSGCDRIKQGSKFWGKL